MSRERNLNPASRSLLIGISSLFSYMYCLVVSNDLTNMPIFGGAMYLCGQVAVEFFGTAIGPAADLLPRKLHQWRKIILILLMLLSLFLIVIYPLRLSSFQLWTVLIIVLAMLIRDEVGKRLLYMRARKTLRNVWFAFFLVLAHIIPALLIYWDFAYNLPVHRALSLMAVYGIADVIVLYAQLRYTFNAWDVKWDKEEVSTIESLQERLGKTNSFRAYQALSTAIIVSLIVTVILFFTYLLAIGEDMLIQMTMAVASTLVTRAVAEVGLRIYIKRKNRHPNPTYAMLFGLLLWFSSLNSMSSMMIERHLTMGSMYLCFSLCVVGANLCLTAMSWMEQAMSNVVRFTIGNHLSGFQIVRSANLEMSRLLGDMLALVIITLVFSFSDNRRLDLEESILNMQPVLLLPALIMVVVAVICTFRFPLSDRYMDKLARFLHLRDEGMENRALKSQIERIVVEEYRQPFGTAFIKAAIRIIYPHHIKGRENIQLNDENPLVFLCNHGDIYGPLVCAAHFPVPMRPWVISQVCTDVDEFQEYFYKYTLSKTHLPESWKKPIAHTLGKLSLWCMRQLEVIPVYRDKPTELIKTFRQSVEAMQTGDNLLIFPENPNAIEQDHGYEHDGLGPLFEGFTLLASIYYKRTHKACRFMPMYAHKGTRTLCFGHEVVYNPEAEDDELERKRVVSLCEMEMRRLMEEQDLLQKNRRGEK